MRNNESTPRSNTKKFLYTGPKKDDSDDQWIFTPRKDNAPRGNPSELDDVWSIKKNVSVSGGKQRTGGNEGLNLKANTTYYSRYGGVKEKDDINRQLMSSNSNRSANNPGDENDPGGSNPTSWSSNYTSKGFSYSSFGGKGETPRASQPGSRPNQSFPSYSNNKDPSLW